MLTVPTKRMLDLLLKRLQDTTLWGNLLKALFQTI